MCGTQAAVIVALRDAVLCYCSYHWLDVALDGLRPDMVISWVNDHSFPSADAS
jgi:hypothetical protein